MKNTPSPNGIPQSGSTAYDQLKSLTPSQRNEALKDTGLTFSEIEEYAEMVNGIQPNAH